MLAIIGILCIPLTLLVCFFVSTVVHEMGHLLGCLITGVKPVMLLINTYGHFDGYSLGINLFGLKVLICPSSNNEAGAIYHDSCDDFPNLVIAIMGPLFSLALGLGMMLLTVNIVWANAYALDAQILMVSITISLMVHGIYDFWSNAFEGTDGVVARELLKKLW